MPPPTHYDPIRHLHISFPTEAKKIAYLKKLAKKERDELAALRKDLHQMKVIKEGL